MPEPKSLLRKREVLRRVGLSDATVWRLERDGQFPRRVVLTAGGAVGWFENEITDWIHERIRGAGKKPTYAAGAESQS